MKRITLPILLVIFTLILSCDEDDSSDFCNNIAFPAPTPDTTLIFIDEDTEEDLFTNGTLSLNDVTLTDLDTGEIIFFEVLASSDNFNIPDLENDSLTTINLDLGTEERNYNIEISVAPSIQFTYNFGIDFIPRNPREERCIDTTILLDPVFNGVTFEQDEIFTRFFTIFL